MDLSRYLSTKKRNETRHFSEISSKSTPRPRAHLPLIASPVNDEYNSQGFKGEKILPSGVSFSSTSSKSPVIRKHHEEASTIELFYDLFFVGNLAYFAAMHQRVDAESILNYLKLFTLMWFTWLSTVLYDVRFAADSILNRVFKAVHFGVMAGFVFGGPIFDGSDKGAIDQNAFKAFTLILMVSRAIIACQYSLVMWQSRAHKRALLPLGLTVFCNILGSLAFLAAHFAFPNGQMSWTHLLFLFLVAIFDGLATMLIAIFWRSISFKHNHLVERVGLLSLIIMGEGIIVLLIYLIWMLYFDQIEHERLGTIRQQIWALLHYPLHVAILLCVEGNTSLIVWNSVVQGLKFVWGFKPVDVSNPAAAFTSSTAFTDNLNASMWKIDAQFKSKSWATTYNWNTDIAKIANLSSTFKPSEWNNATGTIILNIYNSASVFVFEAHSETLYQMLTVYRRPKIQQHLLHKTKYEFGEMINRTMIGFVLAMVGVVGVLANKTEYGFKFAASSWIIPIAVFAFLTVIALDNILLSVASKTYKRRSTWSTTSTMMDPDNDSVSLVRSNSHRPETRQSYSSNAPYNPPQDIFLPSPPLRSGVAQQSRGPSRSTTPVPVPIHMAMGGNFKTANSRANSYEMKAQSRQASPNRPPLHAGGRSGGYAIVGDDDQNY
ncbi:hypothetical protein EJ08DRAFT_659161 [Tothia fuscella]|uniref:Low temperature requirement A n=1 Tax=Tothia fuscella TaxID=1048955 RepID=A0A9P4NTX8_9PEZI|nr:hypothetical protein EJ08DRAFT_659161 [Tothia fuscella]